MKPLSKLIISLIFTLIPLLACSQVDSSSVKRNAFEVHINYSKFISYLTNFEEKLEAGAGLLLFDHFRVSFNYGTAKIQPKKAFDNAKYKSEGDYFRLGVEYQGKLRPGFFLSVGVGYAKSEFDDHITTIINSNFFEEYIMDRQGIKANWYSIIAGSEMELSRNLLLGWKFRMRFLESHDRQFPIDVYTVPGYGRAEDKSIPSINLYAKYSIPF